MKKGTTSTVLALVIIIFVMIILAVFVFKWWYGATEKAGLERCLQSITVADAIGKKSEAAQGVLAPEIDCERQRVNIKLKDYQDDNKKIDYNKLNTDIADKMMKLWQATGEGKKDPYNKWGGDEIACVVGYEIVFDKAFIEQRKNESASNVQVVEFPDWIKTHSPSRSDKTYKDTFSLMMFEGQPIDATKKYAIVVRADSDKTSLAGMLVTAGLAGTGAAVAGAKIGAAGGAIVGTIVPGVGTAAVGIVGGVAGGIVGFATGTFVYLNLEGETASVTSLVFVPEEAILEKMMVGDKEHTICKHLYN